jgi:hypothetical protein
MRLEQPNLSFFNTKSGLLQANIWSELDSGCWKTAQFKIHETNTLNGVLNRANMAPVLPDLIPLEVDQSWNHLEKRIEENLLQPKLLNSGLEDFLCKSKAFFEKFSSKHIAVQLSGGVDSSLIIGLLKLLGIKHSLIGYYNRRYEFRTESYIQKILAEACGDAILINYEDHLPYSGLLNTPPHQYPDMTCCGLSANQAMASACHDAGIEILLTGCGGDIALGDSVENQDCSWIPAIFNYCWFQDIVFTPKKVTLLSFFSDHDILECLWNLRRGQKSDPKKLWARNFFRDFLPRELVGYTYKADFWGLYIDGLINSLPQLHQIHGKAYDLSESSYFSEDKLNHILKNDLNNCDQQLYQRLEARISSAVWINSLLSN